MQTEEQNNTTTSSDEIDLIEVIRYIWNGRWLIVKVTGIFIVLGLVIALTSQNQYKAEARLLPEVRDTQGGASALLRQFGGMGGFNLPAGAGAGADAIRPDLYPDVLKSTPFFIHLMEQPIKIREENYNVEEVDVLTYMTEYSEIFSFSGFFKKYTIRLPWTIMGWIRSEEGSDMPDLKRDIDFIDKLDKRQFSTLKILRNRISSGFNDRTGVISISAEFHDPIVSTQIANFAVKYLIDYITDYRIEKAQNDFAFVKERHSEKEEEFRQTQITLAEFRDANRNIATAAARAEEQRLQDNYNLAFNIYTGLSQQLEQARIKVQEQTPIIKILEPVQFPMERSRPNRLMILMVTIVIGLFISLVILLIKGVLTAFRNRVFNKS